MKYKKIVQNIFIATAIATQTYAIVNASEFCFQDNMVKDKKMVESNLITMKGLDKDEKLQIGGMGSYMLNGVYMGRKNTMVKNGDEVRLLHESIDEDGAKVSTVLMVGKRYDVFTSVTNKGGLPQSSYHIDSRCQSSNESKID